MEREQTQGAVIGALLTLQEPTPEMVKEAATAGFYYSPWGTKHPKIQLLTAAQLLAGHGLSYPAPGQTNIGLRNASKAGSRAQQQVELPGIAKGPSRSRYKRKQS